ncbi:DUF3426 domain-containing protein [Methylophilus luteus]|uniref:DUF3426 domain-containing protein n=1 Tax=Methylophilus luteus TaxID=640108 RepID=A0ABW3F989_9PROT
MSLITECPACFTQFEVNDEQLQAYAGKVRCGECNHVFDARSALLATTEPDQPVAATVVEASPADAEPIAPETLASDSFETRAAETETSETGIADQSHAEFQPAPIATLDSPILDSPTLDSPTQVLESATAAELDQPEITEPAPTLAWNIGNETENDAAIPAFLRNIPFDQDRQPLPEKATLPWVYPLLSGLLLVAILLQLVYFTRTSLAANYPSSKPWLQAACKALHCVVALPSDITQLTIDDADIQEHREREGVLVFSSVLINHGAVAQAYPMIELTLTNMADEPVLRKTLKPAEYLPASATAASGLAAQQEQAVKTTLGIEEKTVTGFRVAIAY